MTFALIAVIAVSIAAFVWLLDRKDQRAHAARDAHHEQVQHLLQRIQAPERAVVQHEVREYMTEDPPQPAQSDAEFWELSEEHMQAIAQLEAMENAPFDRA